MSRPRRLAAALACVAAGLLAGCGAADRAPPDIDRSAVTVLVDGVDDEFFLNPTRYDLAQRLVFLTLTTTERGEPGPRLAERWEHSPDYREWTIHLRRDVRWHDGTPVTAHDIAFTRELWAHPDVLYYAGIGSSTTVLDDHTLRVRYERPSREVVDGWSVYYPRHLLEGLEPKEIGRWDFWKRPIGNGPYRVVRHVPHTLMELEANPDYCCGPPRIRRVVLKFAGGSPLAELLSGNVDAATVSPAELPKLAGDPRFQTVHGTGALSVHLFWNHRSPLFRDAEVRRALTMAIDRRLLHRVLGLPEGLPLTDGIYGERQFERGELAPAWPYDPRAAAQILEEAGWRDRDGDGVREREGMAFRFTAAVPEADWLASPSRAAVFLQDQLRRVGVKMGIRSVERTDGAAPGEFDASIDFLVANPFRQLTYFGEGSRTGYARPEVTELLHAATVTMDLEAQDRLYAELTATFHADVPSTFLYPNVENWVVHHRIGGLRSPDRGNPIWHMEDLWVDGKVPR